MNSSRHFPSKVERLDLALRSGALGDVAGILADMSPGDVAYFIASSRLTIEMSYSDFESQSKKLWLSMNYPTICVTPRLRTERPKLWLKSLSNSMTMT